MGGASAPPQAPLLLPRPLPCDSPSVTPHTTSNPPRTLVFCSLRDPCASRHPSGLLPPPDLSQPIIRALNKFCFTLLLFVLECERIGSTAEVCTPLRCGTDFYS